MLRLQASTLPMMLSFCPLLLVLTAPLHSGADKQAALWTTDLATIPQIQTAGSWADAGGHTITFLDQNRILIGLNFPTATATDARKPAEYFHATVLLVVDARTGKVENARTWPNLKGGGYQQITLRHANSGEFLWLADDHLFRVSGTLETLADRSLNPDDYWYLFVNSSGTSALLAQTSHDNLDSIQNRWISTQSLQDIRVTPGLRVSKLVLADDSVVFHPIIQPPYDSNSLKETPPQVQNRAGQTKPLCSSCPGAALATFGGDFIVVGHHPAASYTIVDGKGNFIYGATHGIAADSIRAANGFSTSNRVALHFGHLHAENSYVSESNLIVFDADTRSEILKLTFSDAGQNHGDGRTSWVSPQLALSPSGKFLAILTADRLQLLSLP